MGGGRGAEGPGVRRLHAHAAVRTQELLEGAACRQAPAEEDRGVGQEPLHLVEPVAREHEGQPLVAQPREQGEHLAHADGVQAGQGLVEDQQLRGAEERAGDGEAPRLAEGEPARAALLEAPEAHQA